MQREHLTSRCTIEQPYWTSWNSGGLLLQTNCGKAFQLSDLLGAIASGLSPPPSCLESVKAPFKTWQALTKSTAFPGCISLGFLPLSALKPISPDLRVDAWRDKGIHQLQQLFTQDMLLPFAALQKKYTLPNSELFTYLHISNVMQKYMPLQHFLPMSILLFFRGLPRGTRGIACCYTVLNDPKENVKSEHMLPWEQDSNLLYWTVASSSSLE